MLSELSPAMDILPFVVMYTCALSTNACDCSAFIPVKLHTSQQAPVRQPRNAPEHPNLLRDVVPRARRLQLLREQPVQLLPHGDNPMRHRLDVPLPILEQLRIIQDQRHLHRFVTRDPNNSKPLTSRAPCDGGLLISLRCSTDSWLFTRLAVFWSGDIMCSAPTRSLYSPAFFAKL